MMKKIVLLLLFTFFALSCEENGTKGHSAKDHSTTSKQKSKDGK